MQFNKNKSHLRDQKERNSLYKIKDFVKTEKTDEHIKVATKLQKDVLK